MCVCVEVFLELFEEHHVATNLCMTWQDRTFGKRPVRPEMKLNFGHFVVKSHKFVKLAGFPKKLTKKSPCPGRLQTGVLTQHIFVVGGWGG